MSDTDTPAAPKQKDAPKRKVTKKPSKKKRAASARKPTNVVTPYRFPKNSLEESLRIAKAIDDKYAGNPTKASDLVKAVGFNKESDSLSSHSG